MSVSTSPGRRITADGRRSAPGPTPSRERADIVAAAVAIADVSGLGKVSMRAVAGRLGTSASALYRYVTDRSELLGLMADHAIAELRPFAPRLGGGIDAMVDVAFAQRDLYRRHPWLADIAPSLTAAGPETLRHFDACLGALSATAMSTRAKFEAIALVTGLAALLAHDAQRSAAPGADRLPTVDAAAYPHLAGVVAGAREADASEEDLLGRVTRGVLRGLIGETTPD